MTAQLWAAPEATATPVRGAPPVQPAPAPLAHTSTGVRRVMFVPSPSWPTEFAPQHLRPPAETAQVWPFPPEAAATPLRRLPPHGTDAPVAHTSTGVVRVMFIPSPSWPLPPRPQHSRPPDLMAQVWFAKVEAAIALTPLVRPTTSTGVRRGVMIVPSPSSPWELTPQHMRPPTLMAQVCSAPAETAATPLVRPVTFTGVVRPAVVPSPSWPWELSPQHLRAPPVVMAQVWEAPAATATTPVRGEPPVQPAPAPLAHTSTGVVRPTVVPSPSWPESLNPQHLRPPPVVMAQAWPPPAATAVAVAPEAGCGPGRRRKTVSSATSAATRRRAAWSRNRLLPATRPLPAR